MRGVPFWHAVMLAVVAPAPLKVVVTMLWCLVVLPWRTFGLLPYVPATLFDPHEYGVRPWPVNHRAFEMENLGGDWYNPAIAKLAPSVRDVLSVRLNRNVTYVMAFKRNLEKGNCLNLVDNRMIAERFPVGTTGPWGDDLTSTHMPQQMMLFDDKKRAIRPALVVKGDQWVIDFIAKCGDIRFETGMHPTKVFAHAHAIVALHEFRYAFWWIELDLHADVPTAIVEPFYHYDVDSPPWLVFQAQNLGVLWSGEDDDPFRLTYWLAKNFDIRAGVPPDVLPPASPEDRNISLLYNGLRQTYRHSLHNTGSPINVDDWCPGLGLALGHSHLDAATPGKRRSEAKTGETRFGNTYVHNLVVFNLTEPYAAVATSPPFCFPSIQPIPNSTTTPNKCCDIIQFVTTFTRLEADVVLVGYGINDCESLWIEIPVADLLGFTDPMLFAETKCQRPSSRRSSDRNHVVAPH